MIHLPRTTLVISLRDFQRTNYLKLILANLKLDNQISRTTIHPPDFLEDI